jgi:hypothetical protein
VLRLFGILVVPAFVIGLLSGSGPVAIVGAFVGLFAYIGVAGGALGPDLRALAAMSPLLAIGAIVPRSLADASRPAAFAVILVLVLVAALLPLWRPHLATAGLGLGLATLISYGLPVTGSVLQLVLAVAIGLAVTATFRLLTGVRDPHGPTREKVAAVLDGDAPSLTDAVDLWLRDGRPLWLGHVLDGAVRARLVLAAVDAGDRHAAVRRAVGASEGEVARLRERVGRLAERVRAREAGGTPGRGGRPGSVDEALARAESAAATRDVTPAGTAPDLRERLDRAVAARSASWRSAQVRHAARTVVGVAIALGITLLLRPGDPLVVTLLMTTFSILQTSWSATFARARPRIAGLAIGALLTAVLVVVLPQVLWVPVALVALVVGLGNVMSRPVLGYSALVCVSVGFNTALRALDPWATLAEFAVLTVAAVVIGVVIGFVVVPGLRPPPLRARLTAAMTTAATALRALPTHHGRHPWSAPGWQEAQRAREELAGAEGELDDEGTAQLERVRTGLADLGVLAVLAAGEPTDRRDVLDAADGLEHGLDDGAAPRLLPALAAELHRDWRALDDRLEDR